MNSIRGKKILLVITKSNWGGAQSYVYTLATYFAHHGALVSVAFGGTGLKGSAPGMLASRLTAAGIPIHVLTSFSRDVSPVLDFVAISELRKVIREVQPYIVHLNSSKAGGIGALAARLSGVPRIIFTAHGWAHRESRSLLAKILILISSWATILLCHNVIVVSEMDYKDAPILFSRKKLALIRNGVPLFDLLSKEEARKTISTLDKSNSLSTSGKWLLMTSELNFNKGTDHAITALEQVLIPFPDTVLVVINEGEDRAKLEKLVREKSLQRHVFLVGFVENAKQYLRAADIFLMPSFKEGMPFGLLEAGYAELPVIASRTGGIPEVIEDGKTGILVKTGDTKQLSTSIIRLLTNPDQAREMEIELKKKIDSEFSEKMMLKRTEALYLGEVGN